MIRTLFTLGIALFLLLLDFVSKVMATAWFHKGSPPYAWATKHHQFLGIDFSFCYVRNTGAAWGILGDWPHVLVVARLLMVVGMLLYLLLFNRSKSMRFPIVLVVVGAIGNIIDYFLYGYVIDMFHLVFWGYDYPVFNVADSLIFIGIVWLILLSFFSDKRELHG